MHALTQSPSSASWPNPRQSVFPPFVTSGTGESGSQGFRYVLDPEAVVFAKITAGTNPYSADEVRPTTAGTWTVADDGTTFDKDSLYPLYEANGADDVQADTIVAVFRGFQAGDPSAAPSQEFVFWAPRDSGPLPPPLVLKQQTCDPDTHVITTTTYTIQFPPGTTWTVS